MGGSMTKKQAKPKMLDEASVRETKIIRSLSIEVDDMGIPYFDFQGKWTGRDVALLTRTIVRAYKRHNRDIRRKQERKVRV